DKRSQRAGRLRIDHVEADLETSSVALVPAMPDWTVIGIGSGEYERAGHHRPVALATGDVVHRLRSRRHAVPRAGEAYDFVATARHLGEFYRRLIGLAAGRKE